MNYQNTFKRHEIKFLISGHQKELLLKEILCRMTPDSHGNTVIRSVYLDTDDFRVIRHSLEKPVYKEKLRLRSYNTATPDSKIFVELKKKYKGVVYKRRIVLDEKQVTECLERNIPFGISSQIGDEIEYFRSFYPNLSPKFFISYQREAFFEENTFLRITFDNNILYRTNNLSLALPPSGKPILGEDTYLLEVKTPKAIPLWLAQKLSELKIYKTAFSKYGTAYTDYIKNGDLKYD